MARRGISGAVMRALRVGDHEATVTRVEAITADFVRVHFRSGTLFTEARLVPTAWVRGWFPDAHGKGTEHQRGYTISTGDIDTGDFTLDFVLHDTDGPASSWARACSPGDTLSVSTYGSSTFEVADPAPSGYLLIGDAAAIPALSSIVAALPGHARIELYLEEHDPGDRLIPIAEHPGLAIHWSPRDSARALAAALESRDWSNWRVWATPESRSLRHVLARLRGEFGVGRGELYSRAYWMEGRAMGRQRETEAEQRADRAAP